MVLSQKSIIKGRIFKICLLCQATKYIGKFWQLGTTVAKQCELLKGGNLQRFDKIPELIFTAPAINVLSKHF